MKKFSRITIQMIGGANVASILLMLFIGHADMIPPESFPKLSNIGLLFPAMIVINFFFLVLWVAIKPRFVIIPLLGFIICYGPVRRYMPINIPHDPPEGCIKVLSYNVWYFAGWEDRGKPNAILEYIKEQNADIVCLQESAENEAGSVQVDSILGPVYQHKDTLMYNSDCLTFFSKYPIISHERIHYASKGNMTAAIKVKIKGRDVIVVNNHLETTGLTLEEKDKFKALVKGELETNTATRTSKWFISHLGKQTKKRAAEAEAVARYIAYHRGTPMIVCGDFNDSPISYAHRTIGKGLTDCYVSTGNGPGISYHKSGMYVRIDNIFCTDDFEPYSCYVDNKIGNSDHYPIICWLKMKQSDKN